MQQEVRNFSVHTRTRTTFYSFAYIQCLHNPKSDEIKESKIRKNKASKSEYTKTRFCVTSFLNVVSYLHVQSDKNDWICENITLA